MKEGNGCVKVEKRVIISAAAGLMAALIVFLFLFVLTRPRLPSEPAERVKLLVAGRDIPAEAEIKPEDIARITLVSKTVPFGTFTDPSKLKGIKTTRDIKAGEIISASAFTSGGKETIPSGYVATSLKVDNVSGVAGMIKPGDRVDIVGTYSSSPGDRISKVILQAIEVFSSTYKEGGRDFTVTLLVKLEDVQKLLLAYKGGDYTLALRGAMDASSYPVGSVTARDLYYGMANMEKPSKPHVRILPKVQILPKIQIPPGIEIVEIK